MLRIAKLWVPVFLWCGLIFYLSSVPSLETPFGAWDTLLRKGAHISEYFILAFLLYRAFCGTFRLGAFYLIFWPALLSFLYAASDEFHQSFVPTRGPSIADVMIDSLGIVLFCIAAVKSRRLRAMKERK